MLAGQGTVSECQRKTKAWTLAKSVVKYCSTAVWRRFPRALPKIVQPAVEDGVVTGIVDIIAPNFGNAWTNTPLAVFEQAGIAYGDTVHLRVHHGAELVFEGSLPFCRTFGDVGKGELLAYTNELMNISFTMNAESIVERYGIGNGSDWLVSFEKVG